MQTINHPAFGGLVNYETAYVPDDPDGSVGATVSMMGRYAAADAQSPEILAEVDALTGGAQLSEREYISRVYDHVKGRIQFVSDERLSSAIPQDSVATPVVEILIRPADMAQMCATGGCQRVGDCDDFSMYAASLLLARGINVKFVTVAADGADPGRFSHVYLAAYTSDGERIPFDASHGPHLGWETGQRYRIEEWPVMGVSPAAIALAVGVAYWLWRKG